MKIDELNKTALRAALSKAADLGWCFEQAPRHRADLAKIIMAYLDRLADEPKPARDRIAVVVDLDGTALGWDVDECSENTWRALEREAEGLYDIHGPFARAIVRCNLPRPAETVEVEGSVEVVS